ncbi:cytochrome o ubiquinol oxidase subunit IV [Sphingomonas oligophenolica]|uniref:Cytochrome bo(3) ubiquinol oxidase subunit 4 n=1 Tax=Sphingomonas oligophenolica TaxID=301154 RepID=A0A502CN07_9SPHN|nr:cytochrome C oxidase subunit IV family protein [Sphingomonas oligophenolica]TPG13156.1 cytochrome-c oxidase [Sphingomonas oligophenolica]
MTKPNDSRSQETRGYTIGYVAALVLTGAAFAAVRWPSVGTTATLAIVFALALIQMAVHFRFFLHIGLARSARDDLQLILFSAVIIILMVSGTLVILFNLRHRMM